MIIRCPALHSDRIPSWLGSAVFGLTTNVLLSLRARGMTRKQAGISSHQKYGAGRV